MVRRLALLAVIFLAPISIFAAPAAVPVTGVVVDASGKPVAAATIAMERVTQTISASRGFATLYEIIATARTDNQGYFSFGLIDPDSQPKGLISDEVVTRAKPLTRYHVALSDGNELTVTSAEATMDKAMDDSVRSVALKVTVR